MAVERVRRALPVTRRPAVSVERGQQPPSMGTPHRRPPRLLEVGNGGERRHLEQILDLPAALDALIEVLEGEGCPDGEYEPGEHPEGEVEREVRLARPERRLGTLDDPDVGGDERRVHTRVRPLLEQRRMQAVGAVHVVLEELVARAEVTQLDRLHAQLVELAPEIALAELRGVVAGADRLDFLLDLGAQLCLDLRLLPPQLLHLRVPRAEPPLQARELGPEVEQREVQLLQARTVEEVGEQVAVRLLAAEPVAALETEARTFRVRELLREVRDPLR